MGGEGTDMTVLVRSIGEGGTMVDEDDEGRRYHLVDFSLVNLVTGSMTPYFLPSLHSCMGVANMVKLGDQPYVIGGASSDISDKMYEIMRDKDPRYYMGACRHSLANTGRWEHIDLPNLNSDCLPGGVAVMMGKVYCFGYHDLSPEVFDPMLDGWKRVSTPSDLPSMPPLELSLPVVPDPQNKRILVHLYSCSCLYAFYPASSAEDDEGDGVWERLSEGFYDWPDVSAVVDNVLYSHRLGSRPALYAYDLVGRKWLCVNWSSLELGDLYLGGLHVLAMLSSVGEGVLWLANWSSPPGERDCRISFFKISVQRTSPTAVLVTPHSFKSFSIPSTEMVLDFVPCIIKHDSKGLLGDIPPSKKLKPSPATQATASEKDEVSA